MLACIARLIRHWLVVSILYLIFPVTSSYSAEWSPLDEATDVPYFPGSEGKSDGEIRAQECALSYRRKQLSNLTGKLLRRGEMISTEASVQMVSYARLLISGNFHLPEFRLLESISEMEKTISEKCLPSKKQCDSKNELFCSSFPRVLEIDRSTLEKHVINYKEASELLSLASQAGNDDAAVHLAEMYASGRGMPVDNNVALEIVLNAAKRGNLYAQWDAAQLYRGEPAYLSFLGKSAGGVVANYKLSYMWFNIAAGNGLVPAQNMRQEIGDKLSSEELALAQKLSTDCVRSFYKNCGDQLSVKSRSWWKFWK